MLEHAGRDVSPVYGFKQENSAVSASAI